MQDEENQNGSEQDKGDGIKKGADSTGKVRAAERGGGSAYPGPGGSGGPASTDLF